MVETLRQNTLQRPAGFSVPDAEANFSLATYRDSLSQPAILDIRKPQILELRLARLAKGELSRRR
jgi:hypothetical protein